MKIKSISIITVTLLVVNFFAVKETFAQVSEYTSQQQQICNWNTAANAKTNCSDLTVTTSIILDKTVKTLVIETELTTTFYKIISETTAGTIQQFELISATGIAVKMKLNTSSLKMEIYTDDQLDPLYRWVLQ